MAVALVLVRTIHIGSAMLLVAFPYFRLAVLRRVVSSEDEALDLSFTRLHTRWMWGALAATALSGVAWFWLVADEMAGESAWALVSVSDLSTVLGQTHFGELWVARLVIGLILIGVLLFASRERASPIQKLTAERTGFLLGCLLLITLAWAGHAAAGIHDQTFHLGVDIVHLLIGAIWPLGLIPLGLFLWSCSKEKYAHKFNVEILKRFSRFSLAAALIIVVSGLINGWLMIPIWRSLVTTAYGELLLAKVAVVLVMVGLGAVNRFSLIPRSRQGTDVFPMLHKTILVESGLAILVLIIVGIMGTTSPPE